MCKFIFHIIFIVLVALAIIFSFVALFTPQWRQTTISNYNNAQAWANTTKSFGLTMETCFKNINSIGNCTNWNNLPPYQKSAIAFLALSIIAGGLALVWAVITVLACCCTNCNLYLLPMLTAVACLFDIIAVMCYGIGSGSDQMLVPQNSSQMNSQSNIGYSMWLAIGAILAFFLAAIDGLVLAKMGKVSPL